MPQEGEKVAEGKPLTRIKKKRGGEGHDPFDPARGK
jgi:hypothetical protein